MHGMTYIGKVISNFKDFYNDINGATLTGAIDVVVVEQPDGTYTCSPFHVRFGKIGVLRSKEKIVDIEINGESVDIHMKLGESGEAFFVEEVPDSDTDEIPDHLATSPIPESELEKVYKAKTLRRNSSDLGFPAPKIFENEVNDYTHRRFTADTGAIQKTRELEFIKRQINLGNIELKSSAENVTLSLKASHSKLSKENLNDDVNNSENIFEMDNFNLEEKIEVKPVVAEVVTTSKTPDKPDFLTVETKSSRRKRRKRASMKKKNSTLKSNETVKELQTGLNTFDGKNDDSTTDGSSMDSNIAELELKDVEGSLSASLKCESDPETVNYSSRKLLDPDFHFFSDTELTTGINDSRPLTPVNVESVLSDTEFEVKNRKAIAKKGQEGDKDAEAQSWGWGEFPSSSNKIPTSSPLDEEHTKSQHHSMLSSVFSFMKHQRKNSNNDGIYLAELSSGAVKPEVAALYLPEVGSSKKNQDADMDCESGNGPSLPQSPNSGEQCKSIDSDYEDQSKGDKIFDDVSISLCGWESQPTEDQFVKHIIPFSDLCNNPRLLESPKVVIRIQNKYLTWKVAAPILVTYMIYRRPLPQSSVDQLCDLYMPPIQPRLNMNQQLMEKEKQDKQEQQPSYSWWNWRRSRKSRETTPALEATAGLVENEVTKVMVTNDACSTSFHKDTYIDIEDIKESDKEEAKHDEVDNVDNQVSKLEKNDKCRKTLRLSSDQIKKLNLKDDLNEVVFSVTTAYQGTTRCVCHLYKWKWDDKVVVSDIDGTITKSDVLGHILPIVGKDWAQSGVAQLFNKIKNNGYKLMYLSARAIGQARITRDYLRSICQDDHFMPDGPVLLNPTSLLTAFHREVIEKKPEQFKIACMSDIKQLFPPDVEPFYAGYGNKINDVWAYRAVGIPIVRIFTINPKGELRHELTQTFQSSYTNMSHIVDQLFPPILESASDFSQFIFWRDPLEAIDDANKSNLNTPC